MTDESKFVLIDEVLRPDNPSWAEDVDDNAQDQAPSKAWDLHETEDKDRGLTMEEIIAEEKKKAELQAKQEKARKPKPLPPTTSSYQSKYERPSRERDNQPRELPTEPPYTAFVGNLPFSVAEDELKNLFVGVSRVRLVKDNATGKGKGYSYIVFETLDDLKRALEMTGQTYCERPLNVDVAKPQQKSTWSNSGSSGFQDRRETREPRESREPNRWGPSASGSVFGDRRNYENKPERSERSERSDRPADKPFGERRAFDKPRTSGPPPSQARPKGPGEDPFGSANLDKKKQDELAAERLKREMEREREREREKEGRRKEDDRRRPDDGGKRTDDDRRKDDDKKRPEPQMSWRSNPKSNSNAPVSPRAFNNRDRERERERDRDYNRPPRTNDDGFKSSFKTKPYEATGTGSAVRVSEAVANAKQVRPPKPEPTKTTEESVAKKNIYDFLEEQDA